MNQIAECRSDMGKDTFRFDYDPLMALKNAPKLMGMELQQCGSNKLMGGYYITGEMHSFRRDKLKVYIWKGQVFVSEEGGQTMSLPNWLIQYGGAADYRDAIRIIKGQPQNIEWHHEFRQIQDARKALYVSPDILAGAKQFDLNLSPLFRHMCKLFGVDTVRRVWDLYNVTATSKKGTCFWYLNQNGQICHDKVCWYGEDGHRIKTLPMSRQYRIGDGYTEKPLFGAHLTGEVKGILESEKSCLYAACYYGGVWYATGGKNNLRDVGNIPLYPDKDGYAEWSQAGDCVPWFEDWPECGSHSDLGDYIEWLILNNSK